MRRDRVGRRSGASFLCRQPRGHQSRSFFPRGARHAGVALIAVVGLAMLGASASVASAAPVWHAQVLAFPTNLQSPGASGEVQNVAVNATGGTYTLTFNGQTTSPALAYNAPAATVQSELNALSTIGGAGGTVSVTVVESYALAGQYVVTFGGALHGSGVPEMTADDSSLTGGPHTVTVALATEDIYQIQLENLGDATSSGTTTVVDHLPPGVTTTQTPLTFQNREWKCSDGAGQSVVTCESTTAVEPVTALYNFGTPNPGNGNASLEPIMIPIAVAPDAAEALTNSVTVSGGGALDPAIGSVTSPVDAAAQTFGISSLSLDAIGAQGAPFTQAGGHPYALTTDLELNQAPGGLNAPLLGGYVGNPRHAEARTAIADLPLGLIGDPLAAPKCPARTFNEGPNGGGEGAGDNTTACPPDTRVGVVFINRASSDIPGGPFQLFNLVPDPGHAAEFGIRVSGFPIVLYGDVVRSGGTYALRVTSLLPQAEVMSLSVTFFGDPASAFAAAFSAKEAEAAGETAFLTNPVDCAAGEAARTLSLHADSWPHPGAGDPFEANFADASWLAAATTLPPVEGCEALAFHPTLSFQPASAAEGGTTQADKPSGYDVNLEVPQKEGYNELATPELRTTMVTLPEGLSVSPSAANGLAACTNEQIALESNGPGSCPLGSQLGSVKITTPLLEEALEGSVYLGQPECSPCTEADAEAGRAFRLFIEVHSQKLGITVKLPGVVKASKSSGRLTAEFAENPQLPFGDLELHFKSGPRAPLANPQSCGSFTTVSDLTPWSAPETATAVSESSFAITGCPASLPFAPGFTAGTASPAAGAFSPLSVSFARNDGEQNLSGVTVATPPGLLGKIAGIPRCGEVQANAGTCSPASQIGVATVSAGPGSNPYTIEGGKVYLTESYGGRPFGLSIAVPAEAGPFKLAGNTGTGLEVVRASIAVNPTTAALTITSNPLPQIIDGAPIRLRTINVQVNRPEFTFNATDCATQSIAVTLTGEHPIGSAEAGKTSVVSTPYAASGCASLPFKPTFSAGTNAHHTRRYGDSLKVVIVSGAGQANIAKVHVELPKVLPSRLSTLKLACSAAQFAANPAGCPAGSFVGTATAYTPVLSSPLTGPAIFVSHGGAAFPDVDIVLQGEGITEVLAGNTNIHKGITTSTFATVPDVPVSRFDLVLPAGERSALAGEGNLCYRTITKRRRVAVRRHGHPLRRNGHVVHRTRKVGHKVRRRLSMPTTITGQNGAVIKRATVIAVSGCPVLNAKAAEHGTRHGPTAKPKRSSHVQGRK